MASASILQTSGIGLMALRLEVPVVPVRLSGLFDVTSLHDSWPRRGTVRVEFGALALPGEGEDYGQTTKRSLASIRSMATNQPR